MFEIKETDKGIELDFSNSEEHDRTGAKLTSHSHLFTFDEWAKFTKEVIELAEPEPELKGRADQIYEILEDFGALTYEELGKRLYPPVDRKRITRLLSQMIRDGVGLERFGSPRQVRLK